MIELPVHRSVIRIPSVMGGDREIVMLSILIAVALIMILMSVSSIVFGLFLLFFSIPMARRIYIADPLLKDCYIRYLRYAHFYFAKSTPFVKIR